MSEYPIFCPRQVRAATREEPAEMCMNEVDEYGDLCPEHDEDDRADELYDAYLEAKYEREHNPDYYTDFGDD
jgi:hypothetical protein